MTGSVLLAVALLAAVFVVGAAARALILAWTRPPRHALHTTAADEKLAGTDVRRRVFERTEPPAGDKAQREAEYATLAAEFRGMPEDGKTYITDRNVWLPRTLPAAEPGPPVVASITDARPRPVMWTPPRQPTEAELEEWKERWAAAQRERNRMALPPPPDVDADVEEWQHILAPAERLATDTDVREALPAWVIEALNGHHGVDACVESIVARSAALAGDHPETALDTSQFPAVIA